MVRNATALETEQLRNEDRRNSGEGLEGNCCVPQRDPAGIAGAQCGLVHSAFWRIRAVLWIVGVIGQLLAVPAATIVWDGGGGNNNINTGGNWDPNGAPSNGDFLIFDGNTRTLPQLVSALTAGSITFRNTAAAFTIGGSATLTINSGGVTNDDSDIQTINTAITLNADQTWNAAAGDLVFGGAVNKNAKALTIDGAYNTTLAGVVSSSGALTKNGTGSLTLSGTSANTFSGSTIVNAGTLLLNKTAGLNAFAGTLVIGDGVGGNEADVVRLMANNQIIDTKAVTIESSGLLDLNGRSETIGSGVTTTLNSGHITTGGGSLTISGPLTLSGTASIATGTGNLTLGNSTVTVTGSSSAATMSGNVSLGGASRTFAINTGSTLSIAATISNGSIVMTNGGTLSLSGANTFSGGATLSAGTISAGHNQALGTGTFTLNGGEIQAGGAARTISNPITIAADSTVNGSLDLTFSGAATLSGNRTLTIANTGLTTFSGKIGESGGSRSLTKIGTGTLVLAGNNTYSGATTISAGTVRVTGSIASSAVTINSGGLLSGGGSVGTVSVSSGATLSPGTTVGTLSSGLQLWSGGGHYLWEINQADGTKGSSLGWDWVNISSLLLIGATSNNRFQIDLSGSAANFDNTKNYSWTIASASAGISGFDASKFDLNTAAFQNPTSGGSFGISQIGNDVNLTFTAVPEPQAYALVIGAGLLAFAMWRRRTVVG